MCSKKIKYNLNLEGEPFPNLKYRTKLVLLLCRDFENKFILGAKTGYYPDGIVQMLGGGIDEGETPINAAVVLEPRHATVCTRSDLSLFITIKKFCREQGLRQQRVCKLSVSV